MRHGRTLIYDEGETDTAALMDFYLHEFRAGGRRLVDCCDPEKAGLLADEKALLDAHKSSRASLFDVVETEPKTARLRLHDMLEPRGPDVMLSDLSMSSAKDLPGSVLLYLRVISCQNIQMSSGCFFTFSMQHRERLRK